MADKVEELRLAGWLIRSAKIEPAMLVRVHRVRMSRCIMASACCRRQSFRSCCPFELLACPHADVERWQRMSERTRNAGCRRLFPVNTQSDEVVDLVLLTGRRFWPGSFAFWRIASFEKDIRRGLLDPAVRADEESAVSSLYSRMRFFLVGGGVVHEAHLSPLGYTKVRPSWSAC